jgi:hypothetical protein
LVKRDRVNTLSGLGLLILVVGFALYSIYWFGGTTQNQSGSSGFCFVIEPNTENRIWSIQYWVDIDLEQNDIWIQVSFTGNATRKMDYYLAIFTPYTISSLDVTIAEPASIPTNWKFENSKSGSIVFATFSLTGDGYESPKSRIKLHVFNSIISRNYGSYTLDIPFGSPPSFDVQKLLDDFPIGFSEHNYYMLLTVGVPQKARLTHESEEVNDIRFTENSKTVEFNIFEPGRFLLQYDNQSEIDFFQFLVFFGGILIGSGISIIASETGLRGIARLYRFLFKLAKNIINLLKTTFS